MGFQQTQSYCNLCGKATLHTRTAYEVPHVLHLLLTVFCCGFWLPIWLLHIVLNELSPSRQPFRCTYCGQIAGQLTPEQKIAGIVRRAEERRRQIKTAQKAAVSSGEVAAKAATSAWTGVRIMAQQLKKIPGQIDRGLRVIAGEGNEILYRFFQVLTVALVAAFMIGLGTFFVKLLYAAFR